LYVLKLIYYFALEVFKVCTSRCNIQLVLCVQADAKVESEPFSTDADLKRHIAAIIRAASVRPESTLQMIISATHCSGKSIGAV